MPDSLPPDDSDKPLALPTQPSTPVVIISEKGKSLPRNANAVHVILEDGRVDRALPPWVKRLIWFLVVTLFGAIGTIVAVVYWVLQLKAQVEVIDSKIDAKVAAKSDDVRKEVLGEAKSTKDDLDLLNRSIEFERSFREMICQGSYDFAIQEYYVTLNYLRPKDIPEALKPSMYRLLIEAVVKSGKYGVIKEDELDRIDGILRKDLASCGAGTIDRIALLYATMGKFDKARTVSASVVNIFAVEREGVKVQEGVVAPIYATLLLIEICQQHGDNSEVAVQAAWRLLLELESRRHIRTDSIDASFDLPELSAGLSYILLRQNASLRESFTKLRQKLIQKDFVRKAVQVQTPSGVKTQVIIEEVDSVKSPKDPPKVGLSDEC
jgi:hypothetical protein